MKEFLIFYLIVCLLTTLVAHLCLKKNRDLFQFYGLMVVVIGFFWFITWPWVIRNIVRDTLQKRRERQAVAKSSE